MREDLEESDGARVVGAVYLTMREGASEEYKTVPLNTSLKGWKTKWFYTGNVGIHEEDAELPDDIDTEVNGDARWQRDSPGGGAGWDSGTNQHQWGGDRPELHQPAHTALQAEGEAGVRIPPGRFWPGGARADEQR